MGTAPKDGAGSASCVKTSDDRAAVRNQLASMYFLFKGKKPRKKSPLPCPGCSLVGIGKGTGDGSSKRENSFFGFQSTLNLITNFDGVVFA